jgi:hypothetical protein
VAADEGEDEESCGEVEDEGYEERDEDALVGLAVALGEGSGPSYPQEMCEACHFADPLRKLSRCLTGVCCVSELKASRVSYGFPGADAAGGADANVSLFS